MSYYLNEFENNKDYLERGPKAKALMDFNGIPVLAYKNVSDPIQTHMRMMYGHMDWEDYVMKLDEHTLKLIQERDEALVYCTEVVKTLRPGMNVVILDQDSMAPISYNGLVSETCAIEVVTLDYAVERAAFWYVENLTGDFANFALATKYFLLAFRLAVMEDEMSYDDRFSNYRHNKVWRETFASMLWQAGQKLSAKAVEMVKICYWTSFNLSESEVEGYMSSLEDE